VVYIVQTVPLCATSKCMGHWCRAPSGVVLPPRGACVFAPEPNDTAKSVKAAYGHGGGYDDDGDVHEEVERSLLYFLPQRPSLGGFHGSFCASDAC